MKYMLFFELRLRCPDLLGLWSPLSTDYTPELGDIGFFTSKGGFYSLFNIIRAEPKRNHCPPSDFIPFQNPPLDRLVLDKHYYVSPDPGIRLLEPVETSWQLNVEFKHRNRRFKR